MTPNCSEATGSGHALRHAALPPLGFQWSEEDLTGGEIRATWPSQTSEAIAIRVVWPLLEIGEVDRARDLCGRLLQSASDLDLYGEELDPTTGRHLRNFPQALTHLALIYAVVHVIEAERHAHVTSSRTAAPPNL